MSDVADNGRFVGSLTKCPAAPNLQLVDFEAALAPDADDGIRQLAGWMRDFLMRPHAELGRKGHVCPFTAPAAKLGLIRFGTSGLRGSDEAAVLATMNEALRAFDAMPSPRGSRRFRTIIVGFPHCDDAIGLATLKRVQNRLRRHSVLGAKMIGLFEPNSPQQGLVNPAFRPQRSPIPALAIRMLVENDAPFVIRNPLLAPIYLLGFPLTGPRRLIEAAALLWKTKRARPA